MIYVLTCWPARSCSPADCEFRDGNEEHEKNTYPCRQVDSVEHAIKKSLFNAKRADGDDPLGKKSSYVGRLNAEFLAFEQFTESRENGGSCIRLHATEVSGRMQIPHGKLVVREGQQQSRDDEKWEHNTANVQMRY